MKSYDWNYKTFINYSLIDSDAWCWIRFVHFSASTRIYMYNAIIMQSFLVFHWVKHFQHCGYVWGVKVDQCDYLVNTQAAAWKIYSCIYLKVSYLLNYFDHDLETYLAWLWFNWIAELSTLRIIFSLMEY